MLIDANLLLYSINITSPQHAAAVRWWEATLSGSQRVALPWQTLGAFVRIATHPRVTRQPLTGDQAWSLVEEWLDVPVTWVPPATEQTAAMLGTVIRSSRATGNLVTDAQLAALALEHGLEVMTTDADFARFPGVRWSNPLS
jgi:toxin-antitoxin system PIN domain toxin